MLLTRFGFSLRSFHPPARRSHTHRVVSPSRRFSWPAVASRSRRAPKGFCRTRSRTLNDGVSRRVKASAPLVVSSTRSPRLRALPESDGLSRWTSPRAGRPRGYPGHRITSV